MIIIPVSKAISVRGSMQILYECKVRAAKILNINVTAPSAPSKFVPRNLMLHLEQGKNLFKILNCYVDSDITVDILKGTIGLRKGDCVLINSKPDGDIVAIALIDEYIDEESVAWTH